MLNNYLKTALRGLLRHKTFSFINVLGLTGGLTCCLLIFIFVSDEFSYDKFHDKRDRIYRIEYLISDFDLARVPPNVAAHVGSFFTEVESVARLFSRAVSVQVTQPGKNELMRFEEDNVNFADSSLFEIFTFDVARGSLEGALNQPYTVVLNTEIAKKYFGENNPIGKEITMEGSHTFEVIAVVENFPANAHVHFDMLVPYDNMYDLEPEGLEQEIRANFSENWMVSHSPTYVLLREGIDPNVVNNRFVDFIKEKIPENQQKGQIYKLQALRDIHLNNDVQAQAESPGNMLYIWIFIAVGLLTLLIACINFVNLSTAKSLERTREIGMRKVLGASRGHLVLQFLGESLVTTILAGTMAFGLTSVLIPQLNELTGKELTNAILLEPQVVFGYAGLILVTSVLAGLYPAFFTTRISPLYSLKGLQSSKVSGGLSFRKSLMVIQLAISVFLIASAMIIFDQLNMLRSKPLGFQKDHLINVYIQSQNFNNVFGGVDGEKRQQMNSFEEALAGIPGVIGSTASSSAPGFGMVNRNVIPEGFTAEDNVLAPVFAVDYDFISTYEIKLIAGRDFSKSFGTDHEAAFIINEYAVEEYRFGSANEALGKEIAMEGKQGKVVGVVQDFNFLSLSEPLAPLLMHISVPQFSVFSIKIHNEGIPATLEHIEATWNEFFPNETFDFRFLDESLEQNYNVQERFGTTVAYFAILAVLISCLGSYGLIMMIASGRMKEIGIRKVLGASTFRLAVMLSAQFLYLTVVAMLIAIPVTFWTADRWLNDFAYRVDISLERFVWAGMLTIGMVLITISFQAMRTALANPVKALQSE